MEPLIFSVIGKIVPILLVGCVLAIRRGRNKKYPEEVGLTPLFTENLGGAFDSFHSSPPGIRVSVYLDFVVITCWGGPIVLRKGDVTSIQTTRSFLFGQKIRIAHNRRFISHKILLGTSNKSGLDAALRKCLLDEPDHPPDEGTRNA
jgi:hypothetical protein